MNKEGRLSRQSVVGTSAIEHAVSDKRNDDQPKDDAASEVSWRFRDFVRETRRLAEVTRQLVNWTRVIAAIAVLAFAASLLQWEAMRGQLRKMRKAGEDTQKAITATNRLADAARDQADIAMQTQKPQLRAYLGPTFNNFRLTTHPADCDPSTTTFSAGIDENASTIFCYHFKNYGHTAAKFLSMCSNRNNGSFILPDNGDIYIIVDRILYDCKRNYWATTCGKLGGFWRRKGSKLTS